MGEFRYRVNLKYMADFFDVEALGPRVRKIAEGQMFTTLPPEQQRAVRGFIDALDARSPMPGTRPMTATSRPRGMAR